MLMSFSWWRSARFAAATLAPRTASENDGPRAPRFDLSTFASSRQSRVDHVRPIITNLDLDIHRPIIVARILDHASGRVRPSPSGRAEHCLQSVRTLMTPSVSDDLPPLGSGFPLETFRAPSAPRPPGPSAARCRRLCKPRFTCSIGKISTLNSRQATHRRPASTLAKPSVHHHRSPITPSHALPPGRIGEDRISTRALPTTDPCAS